MAAALIALRVIAANIGSVYIRSFTRENIFASEGPSFVKWAELNIIFIKEIYG